MAAGAILGGHITRQPSAGNPHISTCCSHFHGGKNRAHHATPLNCIEIKMNLDGFSPRFVT